MQPQPPLSAEPVNGRVTPASEDDDTPDDVPPTNARDQRSVSATILDRTKGPGIAAAHLPRNSRPAHTHHHHRDGEHHTHRRSSSQAPGGSSPQSARETFLTYFFGQQNAASAIGTTLSASASTETGIALTGRDLAQPSAPTGLMAGKRGLDGTDAAFDMKSLGKHIEAV